MKLIRRLLWKWARRTVPCGPASVYTWRHTFLLRLDPQFRAEYEAALDSWARRFVEGLDLSKIQAGTIDVSRVRISTLP